MTFEPRDWYWIVADDTSRAWSSAAGAYVETWDAERVTRIASEAELADVLRMYGLRGPIVTIALVDAEWSRRVFGEFVFGGETYHADRDSVDNIIGAATMAQAAVSLGVPAGNRYWHLDDPANPPMGAPEFAWKSQSNGMIPMDAPTMVALAKALFSHKHAHFLAARALKETPGGIPADYASDTHWP